jgi:hypothetical protein
LDFLQDAHEQHEAQLGRAIIGNAWRGSGFAYVLSGLVNSGSGSVYDITAGYIYYQGEVYYIPAASFTASGANVAVIDFDVTYQSATNADPVEFSDGFSANVHKITNAIIIEGAAGSGDIANYSAVVFLTGSQALTIGTNYTGNVTLIPTAHLNGNEVTLSGSISCGAGAATLQVITTLPAMYRPTVERYFALPITDGTTFKNAWIRIQTTGAVSIITLTSAGITSYVINLDQIKFII